MGGIGHRETPLSLDLDTLSPELQRMLRGLRPQVGSTAGVGVGDGGTAVGMQVEGEHPSRNIHQRRRRGQAAQSRKGP